MKTHDSAPHLPAASPSPPSAIPPSPTPSSSRSRILAILTLAAIILLGGWLRFSRLDLMEFKEDEWRLHEMAVSQARGTLHLHGLMSSVGLHNPPMTVYLFAVPALFSTDPVFMAGLPALMGTLAIGLTYLLARQWVSRGAALVPALLLAVSPWAALASRKIWAQDVLTLFALLFFLGAVRWWRHGRWRDLVLMALSLAVLNQVHYSSLALWPVLLLLLMYRHSRQDLKRWAVGAALFLAMWVPFAIFLLRSGAGEAAQQTIGQEKSMGFPREFARAIRWQVRLLGHGSFSDLTPSAEEDWTDPALALLLIAGIAATLWRARRDREMFLPLLWFFLPAVLLSFHRVLSHYLYICWPAGFLMMGVAADTAAERLRGHALRPVAFAAFLALLGLLAFQQVAFFRNFLDDIARDGGSERSYGVSYRDKRQAAEFVATQQRDGFLAFRDLTHPRPAEETYYYLYRLAGGNARLVPLAAIPTAPRPVRVYVFLGLGVEGAMRADPRFLLDLGTHPLDVLRVQIFESAPRTP